MRPIAPVNPLAPALSLTVQLLCRGEARGLRQSLQSLKACGRPEGLRVEVEVQLLPWQLHPSGMEQLTICCSEDPALIWWQGNTSAAPLEASARSAASQQARGPWIWWLEDGDLLEPDALIQWAEAVRTNPDALLVAGDGDQLDGEGQVLRRHGALPPTTRLRQLVQEQLYCPGAVCLHRRLLRQLPLADSSDLTWSYREAWLVEVLETNRNRVHVVPECCVKTQAMVDEPTPHRCRGRALELTAHLARCWGEAPAGLMHRYGLQLQQGEAFVPDDSTPSEALSTALETARPWLGRDAHRRLLLGWGLDPQAAPWQERLEQALHEGGLENLWCVTLLRNLLHPELGALELGSPWGKNVRLAERLISPEFWENFRLLRQDTALLHLLNQPTKGIPLIALLHWQRTPELQDQFPLPSQLEAFRIWWANHAETELSHLRFNRDGEVSAEPWAEENPPLPEDRPFGVNLIGHAFEVFGIGEDVRMAALALESAGVPFCVVNVPANNGAAASDRSLEAHTLPPGDLGPYRFNLVCLAAPSHGGWIAREGLAQQRGRTTIVAWPWETQTWPQAWECMIPLADVFWPSSTFTAKALEPFSDPVERPLRVMPMAVHIDDPLQYRSARSRRATCERWGLAPEATRVLFVFDVKSSLERKNPWGAIQAFQRAFPQGCQQNVQLVIKALKPASANPEWEKLQEQAAQDPRLQVIEADLSRHELLALIGGCDVFLSLHRSEGFGRGIAEAGLLGLQVVTSAWGGNVDFCQGEQFHLVPCTPRPIPPGAYAHGEGHCWGEPDLSVALEQLRQCAQQRPTGPASKDAALRQLSISATGQRYRQALHSQLQASQSLNA